MPTIKEIKEELSTIDDLSDSRWSAFESDVRSGVKSAVTKRKREIQALIDEDHRLETMLRYERRAYSLGYERIAGIDEVGRGPLAGPVVAAAVILPKHCKIKGLNDSKKIPKKKHSEMYQSVLDQALAVGIGIVDNDRIDETNIYQATKQAMLEALSKLEYEPDYLLIDAMKLEVEKPQESIIKGDANSLSIAAASIVAKVTRDQLMAVYDETYPGYDFVQNAGYGTKAHLEGLNRYGVTPIHRKTFEPIQSILSK